MSDTLKEICERKREHIAGQRTRISEASLREQAKAASPVRGFKKALLAKQTAGKPALIAELKKASPSRGLIRADFSPAVLAKMMAGKAALIKDVFGKVLRADEEFQSTLSEQYKVFKKQLIHDITPEDFADIYAETDVSP